MPDAILLGAGLANLLLAERLLEKYPQKEILLLDENPSLPTEKTWSFHSSDMDPYAWHWMQPLFSQSWDGYDIAFPRYVRTFQNSKYASIRTSELLEKLKCKKNILWNTKVLSSKPDGIETDKGFFSTKILVDGRGKTHAQPCGYQKFFGLNLRLKSPHGLIRPLLMDVRIPQTDGFRFIYVLPWSESDLLIEDTYYSDTSEIHEASIEAEVLSYAQKQGWKIEAVLSKECAALPIPFFPASVSPMSTGMQGGFFHPTTGYSVPYAIQLAFEWDPFSPTAKEDWMRWEKKRKKSHSFYHALNRMLFLAAQPELRFEVFQRFYRLSEPLIQRFYAGKSTSVDQARILVGKPPVPIVPAMKAIFHRTEAIQ